jgi:hypothetical protein
VRSPLRWQHGGVVAFLLLAAVGIGTAVVTAAVMRNRPAPGPRGSASATERPTTAHPESQDAVPAPPPSTPAPERLRTVAERTLGPSRYADASPQEAATYLQRARRGRRRGLLTSVLAGSLLALATGGFPVALWIDSRTVPDGAQTTEVTVEGYRTSTTALRSGARPSARTVVVTPAVDDLDTVTLEYRWLWPDAGDTLEVYPEDGALRATDEAGTLHLVGGVSVAVFWLLVTAAWVRHRRREQDDRIAHWEQQAHGMS